MSDNATDTRRRVAVTGASGFVGGHIADTLERAGHEVFRFGRRDVENIPAPARKSYRSWDIEAGLLAAAPDVDIVVHCAGAVDDWGTLPAYLRANVDGTKHVLDTWPSARFIHMSSASVYDPRAEHLGRVYEFEADPTDTASSAHVRWLNAYGKTKRMAEELVMREAAERAILLRPHAVYGPGDTQLLPRILRRYRAGRLIFAGSPDTEISLTHVDNLALSVQRAIACPNVVGAVNVADPTAPRIDDTLKALLRATGRNERIVYIPTRAAWAFASIADATHLYGRLPRPIVTRYQLSHATRRFVYDLTRAREELGYAPDISAPEALATVVTAATV
jgi:nucleoside-diphosphate-sugar epimerase